MSLWSSFRGSHILENFRPDLFPEALFTPSVVHVLERILVGLSPVHSRVPLRNGDEFAGAQEIDRISSVIMTVVHDFRIPTEPSPEPFGQLDQSFLAFGFSTFSFFFTSNLCLPFAFGTLNSLLLVPLGHVAKAILNGSHSSTLSDLDDVARPCRWPSRHRADGMSNHN